MPTRKFADLTVNVVHRTIPREAISADARFQFRLGDNPQIRSEDITHDVRQSGSEHFIDNILVVELEGKTYVVDGFGRYGAWGLLKWGDQEVDYLVCRDPEKTAIRIALRANLHHVSAKGNSARERSVIAYKLHKEEGKTYREIAQIMRCTTGTVARYLARAPKLIEARTQADDPLRLRPFVNNQQVFGMIREALNRLLKRHCKTFEEVCAVAHRIYNVTVKVLVGDNEKQIKGMLWDALENGIQGQQTHFLTLLYLRKPEANTGAAHRAVDGMLRIVNHYIPNYVTAHCEDVSNDEDALFNSRLVLEYLQTCKKPSSETTPFQSVEMEKVEA